MLSGREKAFASSSASRVSAVLDMDGLAGGGMELPSAELRRLGDVELLLLLWLGEWGS